MFHSDFHLLHILAVGSFLLFMWFTLNSDLGCVHSVLMGVEMFKWPIL